MKARRPEAASVALREIIRSEKDVLAAEAFLAWMYREHVAAQLILYSAAEVEQYLALRKRGAIPESRHWALFVLGTHGGTGAAKPADLLPFVRSWNGTASRWAVCAFGANEAACATTALTLGGHARVGFENNLLLPDGLRASSNEELVAVAAQAARLLGYPLADADTLRDWFA